VAGLLPPAPSRRPVPARRPRVPSFPGSVPPGLDLIPKPAHLIPVSRTGGTLSIRTVIADDEPLAREWLRLQIQRDPDVEIVRECEDGFQAARDIEELRPDLVFLDVQMPGLDGFGVLETLGKEASPSVVFVTAYDQYALRAFDSHALDYILKPFGQERVRQALDRAKLRVRARGAGSLRKSLDSLLESLRATRRYPEWILLRTGSKERFLRFRDVDWVEAARNNVILHVGGESIVHRETMQGIEERLDPERFLRIHRSTIVALDRIRELQPGGNGGDWLVTLRDGTTLSMSESYRGRLRDFKP